ncbi:MAG TPA: MFS transporter [Arachnia sp.]|nr:MFS transporter [Arachnia sp.]HMT85556.1 MFS transporter [Arachnia sp.]
MTADTYGVTRQATTAPQAPRAGMLLGTQLLFNAGFFAVVPFLAGILRHDFALAGASVGLVLGLRTAAQQGLFLVGGTLADRFGARVLILLGCAVRVSGFSLLAWSTSDVLSLAREPRLALFVAGTVLTGMGGALFSPALEALVARVDATRRRDGQKVTLFALLAVFGETGAAIGPLVGAALLGWGFTAVAGYGAGLFVLLALVLSRLLPRERPDRSARGRVFASFARVLADRRYVALAVLASVNLLAYNQLYLGYPVELARVGAGDGVLALVFATVSILTITLQLPIARLARRWGEAPALRLGYLLLTAAFAVLAVAAPLSPADGGAALVPVFASTALLTLGHLILTPLVLSLVPRFGPRECWGAYYGLLATCGGLAVLVGNTLLGSLYSLAGVPAASAAWVWTVLAALPLISGWLVPRLLPAPAEPR